MPPPSYGMESVYRAWEEGTASDSWGGQFLSRQRTESRQVRLERRTASSNVRGGAEENSDGDG